MLARSLLLALFLSGLTVSAIAQDKKKQHLVIGGGIGVINEPYAGLEDEGKLIPAPVLQLQGGKFSVTGTSANYSFIQSDRWEIATSVQYLFAGYEESDSPFFEGMDDRNGTVEAGGWLSYNIDSRIYLTAYAYHDLLDEHGGYEFRGQAAYSWNPHIATNVTPVVGVAFRSEELTDHYYGVEASEARTIPNFNGGADPFIRSAYAPGETVTPYVGVRMRQALSYEWAVFFSARQAFLPGEIKDSPIVDGEGRSYAGIALGRIF